MVARVELQRELDECKSALQRLETQALKSSEDNEQKQTDQKLQTDTEIANEQILRDVKSLRGKISLSEEVKNSVFQNEN